MMCMIKQTVLRNEIFQDLIFPKEKHCRIRNSQVYFKIKKDTCKHKMYDHVICQMTYPLNSEVHYHMNEDNHGVLEKGFHIQ